MKTLLIPAVLLFCTGFAFAEKIELRERIISLKVVLDVYENRSKIGESEQVILSLSPAVELSYRGDKYLGRNRILSWGTHTELTKNGQNYASIKKEVISSLLRPLSNKFVILDSDGNKIGGSTKDFRLIDVKISFADVNGKTASIHRHPKLIGPDTWTIERDVDCLITSPMLIVCATLNTMAAKE